MLLSTLWNRRGHNFTLNQGQNFLLSCLLFLVLLFSQNVQWLYDIVKLKATIMWRLWFFCINPSEESVPQKFQLAEVMGEAVMGAVWTTWQHCTCCWGQSEKQYDWLHFSYPANLSTMTIRIIWSSGEVSSKIWKKLTPIKWEQDAVPINTSNVHLILLRSLEFFL